MRSLLADSSDLARLRAGDLVEVRSRNEILATLDNAGKLNGLAFMPEMLEHCGKRYRVSAVAHKTCDPAHRTWGRRLSDAVHLENLRCDGAAHGGCQASCLLFWKLAWLKRVDAADARAATAAVQGTLTVDGLRANAFAPGSTSERPLYACQATSLFAASEPLRWWDMRQYVRDVTSRNVTLRHAATVLLLSWLRALCGLGVGYRLFRTLYRATHRRLLGREAPEIGSGLLPAGARTPREDLQLRPGEQVTVKSLKEIRKTLGPDCKNRGMWFDQEAAVFCGQTFEVAQRIERIVNEVTGEMMQMKTPSITLKGVYCRSLYSDCRLMCPRAITPYWREIWLRRAREE